MNFERHKFSIGLMGFFSILLPGVLFSYLVMDDAGPAMLGNRYSHLDGTEAWAVFLLRSWLDGVIRLYPELHADKQTKMLVRCGCLLCRPMSVNLTDGRSSKQAGREVPSAATCSRMEHRASQISSSCAWMEEVAAYIRYAGRLLEQVWLSLNGGFAILAPQKFKLVNKTSETFSVVSIVEG
jgi:hypothetical protein